MTSTPISVHFAFLAAIAAGMLAGLLLIVAAVLRLLLVRRERSAARSSARWHMLLLEAVDRPLRPMPRVGRREAVPVLILWNRLYESVRGPMQEKLRNVARRTELDVLVAGMLRRGDRTHRLIAVTTAGNLGIPGMWDQLLSTAQSSSPTLSASAARALVRVDRVRAVTVVAELLANRADWHPARVGPIFSEAGPELALALAERLPSAHHADQVRLIRLFETAKCRDVLPAVRHQLDTAEDGDVIAACLRVLSEFRDPRDAWVVRRFLSHEASFVRVQAAAALGKLGVRSDEHRLINLLTDPEWWVRYRAAQALVSFPFLSADHLRSVCTGHHDRYARDALRQALAEAGAQ